jgi:DNA-binding MarR family transcriptional regulator
MNDETIWETARKIATTQHRLHHNHIRRAMAQEELECPAITPQQVHMLLTVREHGCLTIKQLCQILFVKAPAVSVMVDRLVEIGIFTRDENPEDRREVLIRISPQEEEKIGKLERTYLQLTVDLLDELGPEYVDMWKKLCVRIDEILAKR